MSQPISENRSRRRRLPSNSLHNRIVPSPLDLSTLNPEQRRAVEHGTGPLLIFAGAGSGKTRVITYRIARLIESGVPPYRILAVTFTNKAAREMKERVQQLVGEEIARSLWIGTFHAICSRLLRIDGKAIGISPQFVVYDDGDQMSMVKQILIQKNIDPKTIQPRAVLNEISHAKEQLLSPAEYKSKTLNFFEKTVAEIYPIYQERLQAANALDFDDILLYTVRLLQQSPQVREKYSERFLHVLVDEYQDVNLAQYTIVQLLGARHNSITVVGDDDQSIYAWRGADVGLIRQFGSDHPDAVIIKLEQNYRSTARILNAAYDVIKQNRDRTDKRLWTDQGEGARVTVTQAGSERDEAMLAVEVIRRDVGTGRRHFRDFAVLYRTNAQSRVVEEAMITSRLPHQLIGGQRFYERKEIKDIMSYLRLVLNEADDISFRRIINNPTRGIGPSAVDAASEFASSHRQSLMAAMRTQDVQARLSRKASGAFLGFAEVIDHARELSEAGPVTPVVKKVLEDSGYLRLLKEEHSEEAADRLGNLQELINVAAEFDAASDDPSLAEFLEGAALAADVDSLDGAEAGDAVTLMTLHSAKGLEFPVVFLVGLEEGIFPHSRSLGNDEELQEERRLAYVGMTRAREELHLTHAFRRSLYGTPNFNPRSRFIDCLDPDTLSTLDISRYAVTSDAMGIGQHRDGRFSMEKAAAAPGGMGHNLSASHTSGERSAGRAPAWKPPFDVGQKVKHAKFGVGLVVACVPAAGDAEVTVAFPGEIGVKKLAQKFAKLELA